MTSTEIAGVGVGGVGRKSEALPAASIKKTVGLICSYYVSFHLTKPLSHGRCYHCAETRVNACNTKSGRENKLDVERRKNRTIVF